MGEPSVRRLQHTLDAREFAEWKCYFGLEPFGQDRSDIGAAMVAYTVAGCLGGASGMKPSDFLPRFGEQRPATETGAQMLAKARAYAARAKAAGAYRDLSGSS